MEEQSQSKMININKWELSAPESLSKKYLLSYTASWCKPCQRVKPALLTLVSECKHIGHKELDKDDRPEHVKYIPFFEIIDESGQRIRTIQTSKGEELDSFLNKELVIDDNF
jgi:thiol-disulfide isomerase/thioredoxin